MIRRRFTQRPDHFTVDPTVGLARGLVFAGLGGGHGSVVMRDSSPGKKNDGTLTNMDPATDWQWSEELGRRVLGGFDSAAHVLLPAALGTKGTTKFCWAGWLYYAGVDGHLYDETASGNNGVDVYLDGGKIKFRIGAFLDAIIPEYLLPGGSVGWHHVGCTWGADSTGRVWLDGAVVAENAGQSTPLTMSMPAPKIGNQANDADPLDGGSRLADILIAHGVVWGEPEIQQLADPSNVMLSGLILPPRRRVWPSAVVPLSLPDYPDVENESPFEQDEAIVTVAATGGSAPVSYSLTAQSTTVGMLKVTGTLDPDATGIYTENGTYGGQPAYERTDGAYWIWFDGLLFWYVSDGKNSIVSAWESAESSLAGDYSAYGGGSTGTATVALYAPFTINSGTGEITIADATGLAVGQTWTLTVRATDALSDTAEGTVTVELVAGATVPEGSGSASVVVSATGAGQRVSVGSGTASLVVSAACDGVRTSSGSGAASVAVSASGEGVRESSGAGTASVAVSTDGAGARTSQGSGSVTVTVGATASGSRISQGSGTLSVAVSAVGDGYSPPLAVPEGSGTLTVTVSASASGARQSAGSGLASIAVDAVASGSRASFGSGIASIVATAAGVGRRQSSGGGTLSIAVSASGAGETPGLRVAGPYRIAAAQVHSAGLVAAHVHTAGPTAAQVHSAGLAAGMTA